MLCGQVSVKEGRGLIGYCSGGVSVQYPVYAGGSRFLSPWGVTAQPEECYAHYRCRYSYVILNC